MKKFLVGAVGATVLALALAGCSDTPKAQPAPAGNQVTPTDPATPTDASTPTDAGTPTDGTPTDAGTPTDGDTDAGTPTDGATDGTDADGDAAVYPDVCSLITDVDAATVLGQSSKAGMGEAQSTGHEGSNCYFEAEANPKVSLTVVDGSKEVLTSTLLGNRGTPVPDLGDEALSADGILFFRKGKVSFAITGTVATGANTAPGTTFIPVAKAALAKLASS